MLQTRTGQGIESAHGHRYTVRFAATVSEIREAKKLRYRVLAEEFGAHLTTREAGVDEDFYDAFCEHLIVRDEAQGRIVGTCRVLSPEAVRRVGGYDSENRFYMTRLQHLRSRIVEVGRSCIDAAYRGDAVVALLWAKLAETMTTNDYSHLVGCASIGMADGGRNAANLYVDLADKHMAPAEYQVAPKLALPFEALADGTPAAVPPLLKGYLRAGAWICGEPAWNPDVNSTDLLLLLPTANLGSRFRKRLVA